MSLVRRQPGQNLLALVTALDGRWSGQSALCRCPAHADATPSLSLRQGDAGILVHCFAGCEPEVVLRELRSIRPVLPASDLPAFSSHASGNAERLWNAGEPVEGTLGERYLTNRGFPLLPTDLRFHPRCPRGPRPHTKFLPALLVPVREGRRLQALQRIFVDPRTAACSEKLMLGSPGRGAWQGSCAGEALAIAEGFETAAAFQQLRDIPCWSSLGGERLSRIDVPSSVQRLIIAEDNDREGRRFAARACEEHARAGRSVLRMPPTPDYDDWADVLAERKRGGGSKG